LQALTLLGETAGLLAIVWPRARPAVGLALLAFHVGQVAVFGWGFHANIVVVALVLLPVRDPLLRWASARAGSRERAAGLVPAGQSDSGDKPRRSPR
jgi:hypothetical protein